MIIRPAQEADAERIGQMWLELVEIHRQLDDNMPVPARDGQYRYSQRIRYALNDAYQRVLVAEDDGQLLGYVYGMVLDLVPEMFEAERAGMIGDIFVQEAYRGQGVGRALMQVMKDWFKLRGIRYYEWSVASANGAGIRFWQQAMNGHALMLRMRATINE